MEVKVLVLTNKQILVSQLEEVAPLDIGDPNCKMIEPFLLNEDDTLSPWLIDITNDNDYIYVTIIDNGVGFEHVDKTKMLTPYYTTKKNGTGLGLAVVTKIISDHNSSIYFNTIDEGAKIKITIPKYYGK